MARVPLTEFSGRFSGPFEIQVQRNQEEREKVVAKEDSRGSVNRHSQYAVWNQDRESAALITEPLHLPNESFRNFSLHVSGH